jgi:hypothetical protein
LVSFKILFYFTFSRKLQKLKQKLIFHLFKQNYFHFFFFQSTNISSFDHLHTLTLSNFIISIFSNRKINYYQIRSIIDQNLFHRILFFNNYLNIIYYQIIEIKMNSISSLRQIIDEQISPSTYQNQNSTENKFSHSQKFHRTIRMKNLFLFRISVLRD